MNIFVILSSFLLHHLGKEINTKKSVEKHVILHILPFL